MTTVERTTAALPGRADKGGYVYAIQFSNGIVKVGSTRNPHARITTHRGDASRFGLTVTEVWLSSNHDTYLRSEQVLIEIASSLTPDRNGREYFPNLDVSAVLTTARDRGIRFPNRGAEAQRAKAAARRAAEAEAVEACRAAGREPHRWMSCEDVASITGWTVEQVAAACRPGQVGMTGWQLHQAIQRGDSPPTTVFGHMAGARTGTSTSTGPGRTLLHPAARTAAQSPQTHGRLPRPGAVMAAQRPAMLPPQAVSEAPTGDSPRSGQAQTSHQGGWGGGVAAGRKRDAPTPTHPG